MTNLDRANAVNKMAEEGQMIEALKTYYHDDSVKVEGTGVVTEGLEANLKFHEEWMGSIKEFHGSGVTAAAEDPTNGKVMIESWVDITFQDGTRMKMEEVEVQTWEDGKIKHIRFYYDTRGMSDG